ncbi:urea ABC transporter substrate-binding protein [Paraglaciecola sp.]|nr:urea ABC transporter substrate-binding protein [Paraglaciecola sp.]MDB4282007.1 urea ABC transporter substrate-binding protein [Paraglaciecola sp.]
MSRTRWLIVGGALLFAAGVGILLISKTANVQPIKVGLLHSQTGTMAISERPMIDAELLAIAEINARGGLLGRPIEAVIADGASDLPTFAIQADKLINQEVVAVVFGCWTSASRKTVKPIFEKNNHLLIYPMAYEGLEMSPNIVYTGALPNQQVLPALKWGVDVLGKRVHLVGSDYVWPHAINEIMKDQLLSLGAELVGESYVFFGSTDLEATVADIEQTSPDFIISAIVGDSNPAFYNELMKAGITAESTPVISFSVSESELQSMDPKSVAGHYTAWSYLQGLPSDINADFVKRFQDKYGANRVTSDVIATAYSSVMLWAQAVEEAESTEVGQVMTALRGQSLAAPEGIISIDAATQHAWRSMSLGQINTVGGIEPIWQIDRPIRPVPFPGSRSRTAWQEMLNGLYARWDNSWSNPERNPQ